MADQCTVIIPDIEEGVIADKAVEILKVATELFYEQDFDSVWMRRIARQSGVGAFALSLLCLQGRIALCNCPRGNS